MNHFADPSRRILVTGATGYVGGRLLRRLEERGCRVRCMVRRPEVLAGRVAPDTEVVYGDVTRLETLPPALQGIHTAYYLIHSLASTGDFELQEEEGAAFFGRAAKAAGVKRIVYLGGLCDESNDLSPHLRSRIRVGARLRESGIQVIEFRANIIIGSGSLSFELIRALVQRLPVMVSPRWVLEQAQPISIADVLSYLVGALDLPDGDSIIYEIGGAERTSYAGLIKEYARMRGLRRLIIPLPVLTPGFSSAWLGLVTPLYARVGRRLIDSMTTPSIVRDARALQDFPIEPMGVQQAIALAQHHDDHEFTETHWADALSSVGPVRSWGGVVFRNRLVDLRTVTIPVNAEQAFAPIRRIGGARGWPYANWLWHFRGFLDRCVGGIGMHRGRRDPEWLRVGDALDCWRVEAFEPPRHLLLAAEMRVPGRAWLKFEIADEPDGVRISQTALFDPVGILGVLYWYALWPAHEFIFQHMLGNIAKLAMEEASHAGANPDASQVS